MCLASFNMSVSACVSGSLQTHGNDASQLLEMWLAARSSRTCALRRCSTVQALHVTHVFPMERVMDGLGSQVGCF